LLMVQWVDHCRVACNGEGHGSEESLVHGGGGLLSPPSPCHKLAQMLLDEGALDAEGASALSKYLLQLKHREAMWRSHRSGARQADRHAGPHQSPHA
jgi:hypothetical protein